MTADGKAEDGRSKARRITYRSLRAGSGTSDLLGLCDYKCKSSKRVITEVVARRGER